ncbi:MAG: FG-GAP-like repeat-containing protein, partial [Candidatus Hodarchaeales archaeon]
VTVDFDGEARDLVHPYIGADEGDSFRPDVFSPMEFTDTQDDPFYMTSGDLDNDGDDDLAVVNQSITNGGSEDVSIFWNDGNGNFSGPDHFSFGIRPDNLKIFDLDKDTYNDLLATTDDSLMVRWGKPGGGFESPKGLPYDPNLGKVWDVAFADLLNDGRLHIIQTHFGTVGVDSGWVTVLFNQGNRNFHFGSNPNAVPLRVGMNPSVVKTADLNNDGLIDAVVNDFIAGKTASLLNLGMDPNGQLWLGLDKIQEVQVFSGSSPIHPNMDVGDIDGDSDIDVLLGSWSTATVNDSLVLLRNDGTGIFTIDGVPIDSRRRSRTFALLDYEGDGDQDIVTATTYNDILLYLNDGFGTFSAQYICQVSEFGSDPLALLTTLLDNNASPDVAVLTGGDDIAVMKKQRFIAPQTIFRFKRERLKKLLIDHVKIKDSLRINLNNFLKVNNLSIVDVNMTIDTVLHTRDSDLEFTLAHEGVSDTLIFHAGGNGQNFFKTTMDDDASTPIANGVAPFTGLFQPESPLSQFNGLDPNGDWILEIYDATTGETGRLDAWSLEITVGALTGIKDGNSSNTLIKDFSLKQNYPNPFNPATTIEYFIPASQKIALKVYDILGREVATLVDGWQETGEYKLQFNARNLASGMYFYRLHSKGFVQTRKMLLVR